MKERKAYNQSWKEIHKQTTPNICTNLPPLGKQQQERGSWLRTFWKLWKLHKVNREGRHKTTIARGDRREIRTHTEHNRTRREKYISPEGWELLWRPQLANDQCTGEIGTMQSVTVKEGKCSCKMLGRSRSLHPWRLMFLSFDFGK